VSPTAGNGNYLSNHFSDVRSARQAGHAQAAGSAADAASKTFQKQKELEKLLMKAENEDISMLLKHWLHFIKQTFPRFSYLCCTYLFGCHFTGYRCCYYNNTKYSSSRILRK